ncbi:unnamed protein product [Adineta ricciae]|uniref:Phosphoenolpyruvate synthase n=1 Tax=Adineta ricciae TaxID=249248 RepID=A0A815N7E8_ADIRI|nr:unnamed protein product [Adineta ricciae]
MSIPYVVHLEDQYAVELDIVGGKGANLALLYQRQFRVPNAFIITTHAYELALNRQVKSIFSILDRLDVDNLNELETASNHIKSTICNITLPDDQIDLIMKSYDRLYQNTCQHNFHVAVRSSATAEDLPENSFAGQQDTYLHVTRETLIEKVKECWASLFTSRAISYRNKSHIDHKQVKLAVVVQEMVSSEVSGVAFTANPITGLRNEVVIDSTYGLGEALVSGLVTPDHYEILFDEDQQPKIRVKNIGEKTIRIIGKSNGGTDTLVTQDHERIKEALSDENILQLAILAKQVERSYDNRPQDLEWGFAQGNLYILQARPITTLFPIPKRASGQSGLRCMVSFGTIQGFLEPMTPLGESTIRTLMGSFLRTAGIQQNASSEDDMSSDPLRHIILKSAANRLWIDISGMFTSPLKRIFGVSMVDTGMNQIVQYIKSSKTFTPPSLFSAVKFYFFLMLFVVPVIIKSIRNFIFPRYGKQLYRRKLDKYHQFVDQGFDPQRNQNFTDCVNHFQNIFSMLPSFIAQYGVSCILPAIVSLRLLQRLAKDSVDALALTRAVESNPTTEMNLTLWKLTVSIKNNASARELFGNESTDRLVNLYQERSFESMIQFELEEFFRMYGCRGIGEIDLGRKRWCEEPQIIFEQIKNYLKITNPMKAIDKIHEQSQQTAYETYNRIEQQLRWPFIQKPLLSILFSRLRILFSVRESPKFHGIIQTFGKCRRELFRKAQLAVDERLISQVDDICYLYIDELHSLAVDTDQKNHGRREHWQNLITQRRTEYQKQMLCKRVPLILLSDGTTYYDATTIPDENSNKIELMEGEYSGSPVSPGVYEGQVRIVDDPINSHLQPGEILVCTATDPAWTSLFPIAGALVLEMGGMLQHGAIVSREYGLPAVVGVANAKRIFHNGQMIQVNGSNGRIKILAE